MISIKIDSKDFENYKKSLHSLSKSAMPTAVRNTLNNAGFEMKKNQLHKAAKEKFKYTRAKNFFKTFSYVNKSTGSNINKMSTKVGLRDLGKKSAKSAVENMNMHQFGGNINKGNAYLDESRVSKNRARFVRKKNYLKKGNVLENLKGNFVQKAYEAHEQKKPFWHSKNGNNYLVLIKSFKRTGRSKKKKIKIKSELILKKRKNARIKPNKFISLAAKRTSAKIPELYKVEFNKQFKKYVGRKVQS